MRAQIATLTKRELDVIRALTSGMSNVEIAAHLQLEAGTVKTHLGRILAKLSLRDRTQLAVWALRAGVAK